MYKYIESVPFLSFTFVFANDLAVSYISSDVLPFSINLVSIVSLFPVIKLKLWFIESEEFLNILSNFCAPANLYVIVLLLYIAFSYLYE